MLLRPTTISLLLSLKTPLSMLIWMMLKLSRLLKPWTKLAQRDSDKFLDLEVQSLERLSQRRIMTGFLLKLLVKCSKSKLILSLVKTVKSPRLAFLEFYTNSTWSGEKSCVKRTMPSRSAWLVNCKTSAARLSLNKPSIKENFKRKSPLPSVS